MIQLFIGLGILAAVGGTITAFKLYIEGKDEKIEQLQAQVGELNTVIETKDSALQKRAEQIQAKETEIDSLMKSMKTLTTLQAEMQKDMQRIRSEAQEAQRIFAEHDVPKLMDAKPEWMTKIMQKGTAEKWESFKDL